MVKSKKFPSKSPFYSLSASGAAGPVSLAPRRLCALKKLAQRALLRRRGPYVHSAAARVPYTDPFFHLFSTKIIRVIQNTNKTNKT